MLDKIYEMGLEKFAGDEAKALEFTEGFVKEAAMTPGGVGDWLLKGMSDGAGKAIGAGAASLAMGLGIHGVSSTLRDMSTANLHQKYEAALQRAVAGNVILRNADPHRLKDYGDTIFKFAPHVAGDANLLANVLASAVHGESIDVTMIRTLTDLESRYNDTRKNALFTPKAYS